MQDSMAIFENLMSDVEIIHQRGRLGYMDFYDFCYRHLEALRQTVCTNALYPHKHMFDAVIYLFDSLRDKLILKDIKHDKGDCVFSVMYSHLCPQNGEQMFNLNFYTNKQELPRMKSLVDMLMLEMEQCQDVLYDREDKVMNDIRIETRNNPVADDGQEIYLTQGLMIMKTSIRERLGYHAFDFRLGKYNEGEEGPHYGFFQKAVFPEETLESAIDEYMPRDGVQTLLIVHNSEKYMFNDTVIPVIIEKYGTLLCQQGTDG